MPAQGAYDLAAASSRQWMSPSSAPARSASRSRGAPPQRGLRVTVLERGEGRARARRRVAAGMLAPVAEATPDRGAAARARAAQRAGVSGVRRRARDAAGMRPRLPALRHAARRARRRRGGGARARVRAAACARARGRAPAAERGAPARAGAGADAAPRARGPRRPRDRSARADRGTGTPPRPRRGHAATSTQPSPRSIVSGGRVTGRRAGDDGGRSARTTW